jgi:hypothetical protein
MHHTRQRLHISPLDTELRGHSRSERVAGVVRREGAERQRERADVLGGGVEEEGVRFDVGMVS